jgi:hypothetical protein
VGRPDGAFWCRGEKCHGIAGKMTIYMLQYIHMGLSMIIYMYYLYIYILYIFIY